MPQSRPADRIHLTERSQNFKRVKSDTSLTKWGNRGEFLLNGIIAITNTQLWGKKRNLLYLMNLV